MNIDIGGKIRSLRKNKGISITELAKKTELSTGLISQIERGMVGTSVESLWKISQALHVSIGYFFDEQKEYRFNPVVRKNQRKAIEMSNSSAVYQLLSPNLNRKIEFLCIKLKPNEPATNDLISHDGEECGIVLQGKLLVKYGTDEYTLEEGDSIYLDSIIPHRYINIGDDTCVSIWAMTPPSF